MTRLRKGTALPILRDLLKVETTECLIWPGGKNTLGYGILSFEGKSWLAHRLAYYFKYGHVGSGRLLRHTCDNPACINPLHLLPGDDSDNMADMVNRGRQCGGIRRASKLTYDDVLYIRENFRRGTSRWNPGNKHELAKRFNVDESHIRKIAYGVKWHTSHL